MTGLPLAVVASTVLFLFVVVVSGSLIGIVGMRERLPPDFRSLADIAGRAPTGVWRVASVAVHVVLIVLAQGTILFMATVRAAEFDLPSRMVLYAELLFATAWFVFLFRRSRREKTFEGRNRT